MQLKGRAVITPGGSVCGAVAITVAVHPGQNVASPSISSTIL